jgi:predicted O-linked N-acetylglucosamine transferase (SPINDLY family)
LSRPSSKSTPDEVEDLLDKAFLRLALDDDHAEAWRDLGRYLLAGARSVDALAAFSEALRLASDPLAVADDVAKAAIAAHQIEAEIARRRKSKDSPANLLVAAKLLRHDNRLQEAAAVIDEAGILASGAREVAAERAIILFELERDNEAEPALRQALALDATNDGLRHKLAKLYLRAGRPAAARRELAACVDAREAIAWHIDMALAELQLGRQTQARKIFEDAVQTVGDSPHARQVLATVLAYADGVSGIELTDAMRSAAAAWRIAKNPPRPPNKARSNRLRLGFLGGGFWRHPSSWLTIRGVEALDPDEFEIHVFTPNLVGDDFTARWKACATGWHVTQAQSDEAVARNVRRCGIDVLVDLGGYLNLGRMTVMAHRPAALQIKWVGAQFHTSGFDEIDGFVSDVHETPDELAHLYTESLLTMSGSYICYSPPTALPDVGALPAGKNGYVTFGSLNNLMKITPRTLDAWAEILRRVEGSQFRVRAPQFDEEATRSDFRSAFHARGIMPDRLQLSGSADHLTMLADYNSIDIALQPFPYCGGVTLLEGLVMGVASVSFGGETFASRHGVSHLRNIALSDFVTWSHGDYIATAVRRSADFSGLGALRASLRPRLFHSVICDSKRFALEFTHLLKAMWKRQIR